MTLLHDVQARLLAFLDEHYHKAPHGGLLGQTARKKKKKLVERDIMARVIEADTRERDR